MSLIVLYPNIVKQNTPLKLHDYGIMAVMLIGVIGFLRKEVSSFFIKRSQEK